MTDAWTNGPSVHSCLHSVADVLPDTTATLLLHGLESCWSLSAQISLLLLLNRLYCGAVCCAPRTPCCSAAYQA